MEGKVLAIQRKSVRDQVFEHLREDILSGRLPAGARLVETQIAAEMGISRTPVREALPILENEGLVEGSDGAVYRVTGMRWEDVEELCAMRIANESLAATWAAERITAAEIKALEENLNEAQVQIQKGNPEAFVAKDSEFHEILIRASGRKRMFELCQILRRHMLRYRMECFHDLSETQLALSGHVQILEALKKRDVPALQASMRNHIEEALQIIKRCAFSKGADPAPS